MNKQEIQILKTLCDIRLQLEKPQNDLWKIYKSLNRQTPEIIDDMLEEIKLQACYLTGAANVIIHAQPTELDGGVERETLNELFEDSNAGK